MDAVPRSPARWSSSFLTQQSARTLSVPVNVVSSAADMQRDDDDGAAAVSVPSILFAWGRGDDGQLGLGDLHAQPLPTVVPTFPVGYEHWWDARLAIPSFDRTCDVRLC